MIGTTSLYSCFFNNFNSSFKLPFNAINPFGYIFLCLEESTFLDHNYKKSTLATARVITKSNFSLSSSARPFLTTTFVSPKS